MLLKPTSSDKSIDTELSSYSLCLSKMAKSKHPTKVSKEKHQTKKAIIVENNGGDEKQKKPHSWALMRNFFTCKHLQAQVLLQHQQEQEQESMKKGKKQQKENQPKQENNNNKFKKLKCSTGSNICNNTKIMHRPEPTSPEDRRKKKASMNSSKNAEKSTKSPMRKTPSPNGNVVSASSSSTMSFSSSSNKYSTTIISGSFKAMPFRKLSGCYECRMVIDPVLMMARDPTFKSTISSCPQCGEIFMKPQHLELHQAVRHAVSELDSEDTSKNIVEIIFQSSWLKKQVPVCKIERILKVHNTPKTLSKFEEYRESIKSKASNLPKKHARCIADGNELLRFHCTTFMCSLGLNGSSNLCNSIPNCNACSIIKNGFKINGQDDATSLSASLGGRGILTTATSGKAHDNATSFSTSLGDEKRAMLVCRVIAGRVKKNMIMDGNNINNNSGNLEEYDSVAGATGVYSNLDELYVFNPKAILPCFVVVYGGF
ncbi:hypothetical protein Leryth_009213 [Lithospermum erythrorhizon]|nr:hypothetical protein Leryth_009213 [Lithospermum erythrorhizon]